MSYQYFKHGTWLQGESFAYPAGGQTRKGRAIFPDGVTRVVWAGIPDTYFSIPAHARVKRAYVRGWVGVDNKLIDCPNLATCFWPGSAIRAHANGELHCELCQFGFMDSPTRGALLFHPSKQTGGES